MKYMILLNCNEATQPTPGTPEFGQLCAEYQAFGEQTRKDGVIVEGEALQGVATATTLAVRNGENIITDGPYTETKEQLCGYYIIDVENLDEAIKYSALIPAAKNGNVEIRPVMIIPG